MKVGGTPRRTIWLSDDQRNIEIIDQTRLPHEFAIRVLTCVEDVAIAIATMQVRGAPLIGAAAAYGLCLQTRTDASDAAIAAASERLLATRPTAVNLAWALEHMRDALRELPLAERVAAAYRRAAEICDEDVATCRAIGEHGAELIAAAWERAGRNRPVNVLTHCNAGWLATVDWGTALAPVYVAAEREIPVHVWVSETRPRNQGAALTAWELAEQGIPHTVIADNAAGHLLQHGRVDLCLTGSDRTTARGDVCNKIGTYLKALSAHDNGVPFYVALPHSTIDWQLDDGVEEIPIEERDGAEVRRVAGRAADGRIVEVDILPDASPVSNFAFDVTPARLVTGLVTERGVCEASRAGLVSLYPERGDEAGPGRVAAGGEGGSHRQAAARPASGTLHLVATPIGNLEDVTLRGLRVLREADLVFAEDTRRTRKLLDRHDVAAHPVSLHAHNEAARIDKALAALAEGASVAVVSDAGTPLVSDPGARLVAAVIAAGFAVVAVPGASALLAALSVAGLPVEPFAFLGFLPRKPGPRKSTLAGYSSRPETLVLFESPRRLAGTLRDLAQALGDRPACVARELTKLHEEAVHGSLSELAERFDGPVKGEIVIVVAGASAPEPLDARSLDAAIRERLGEGRAVGSIASELAPEAGLPRREVYARVVALRETDS